MLMTQMRATHQSRGPSAAARFVQRLADRLLKLRMGCETEIVVGGEIRQHPPVARDLRPLRGVEDAQGTAQTLILDALELDPKELIKIHPFIKCSICLTAVSIPVRIARETME